MGEQKDTHHVKMMKDQICMVGTEVFFILDLTP